MLNIGPYQLHSRTLLAPMAGITDLPFRKICRALGAGLATSEMLTSDTGLWSSDKSAFRLSLTEDIAPISIQIAGSEPEALANAAQQAVARGAQIIDINMGCPAKKVCKKLAGSSLLKDEVLVAKILNAVVASVDVPVTLKIRTGWDPENRNGLTVAKIAEESGIQALAVHGRTRACRFLGEAEFETIREIVSGVSIPVIANGDIRSAKKAKWVLDKTGADAIMVGRGAQGNPWIFKEINRYLEKDEASSNTMMLNPDFSENKLSESSIAEIIEHHFLGLYSLYGELKGLRVARKHFNWYCQTFGIASSIAKQFNTIENTKLQLITVRNAFEQVYHQEEIAA